MATKTKTTTEKTAKTTKTAKPAQITHEMIATRAYHIWLGNGQPNGQETAIWLQAERELAKTAPVSR